MLASDKLTMRFGGHTVVDQVSCVFSPGVVTAIIGPNGAGKTTYFNLLSGQLRPTSGRIAFSGRDITRLGSAHRARLGIGRAFQLTTLFSGLSVFENVRLAVQARNAQGMDVHSLWQMQLQTNDQTSEVLRRVGLAAKTDILASGLSHGDQRKLELAILLGLESRVLLLDEPTAGMSVDDMPNVIELIQSIKERADKTILLVEHKMEVIRLVADHAIVLHQGKLIAEGHPADLMKSTTVQDAYLGGRPGTF